MTKPKWSIIAVLVIVCGGIAALTAIDWHRRQAEQDRVLKFLRYNSEVHGSCVIDGPNGELIWAICQTGVIGRVGHVLNSSAAWVSFGYGWDPWGKIATCRFDNQPIAGHSAVMSPQRSRWCHDSGEDYPWKDID